MFYIKKVAEYVCIVWILSAAYIPVEASPEGQVTFGPILHCYVMNCEYYHQCILVVPGQRRPVSQSVHDPVNINIVRESESGNPVYYIFLTDGYVIWVLKCLGRYSIERSCIDPLVVCLFAIANSVAFHFGPLYSVFVMPSIICLIMSDNVTLDDEFAASRL